MTRDRWEVPSRSPMKPPLPRVPSTITSVRSAAGSRADVALPDATVSTDGRSRPEVSSRSRAVLSRCWPTASPAPGSVGRVERGFSSPSGGVATGGLHCVRGELPGGAAANRSRSLPGGSCRPARIVLAPSATLRTFQRRRALRWAGGAEPRLGDLVEALERTRLVAPPAERRSGRRTPARSLHHQGTATLPSTSSVNMPRSCHRRYVRTLAEPDTLANGCMSIGHTRACTRRG
jgi:hypothetical protein